MYYLLGCFATQSQCLRQNKVAFENVSSRKASRQIVSSTTALPFLLHKHHQLRCSQIAIYLLVQTYSNIMMIIKVLSVLLAIGHHHCVCAGLEYDVRSNFHLYGIHKLIIKTYRNINHDD
mmetsp:Transcript_27801/g.40961  ORF Transcript_27801/g.40961 Transcript_27801/m.40961 type:complete len:120 (+) Transcript_27801:16-375(+)